MDKVQLENQHYTTTINSLKKELEEAHLNFEEENKLLVGRVQHLQGELTQSEGQLGNLQSEKLKLQNSHDTLLQNLTQTQSDFEKKEQNFIQKIQSLQNQLDEQIHHADEEKQNMENLQKIQRERIGKFEK